VLILGKAINARERSVEYLDCHLFKAGCVLGEVYFNQVVSGFPVGQLFCHWTTTFNGLETGPLVIRDRRCLTKINNLPCKIMRVDEHSLAIGAIVIQDKLGDLFDFYDPRRDL
jgi:hypothetical protein